MMTRSERLDMAMIEMIQRGIVIAPETCCLTCGQRCITELVIRIHEEAGAPLEKIKGCCFYTKAESLGEEFYLAFGQIPHPKYGPVGMATKEVGELVCECLKKYGLAHEWDGDPGKRVLLKKARSRLHEPSLN